VPINALKARKAVSKSKINSPIPTRECANKIQDGKPIVVMKVSEYNKKISHEILNE
jgi:hypothetical protein